MLKIHFDTPYQLKRRFLRLGMLICAIILCLLALLTYYTQYSGNFVMVIDEPAEAGIVLCDNKSFVNARPFLQMKNIANIKPTEYSKLNIADVCNRDGNYISSNNKYIGYTFYLKNNGIKTVDIDYTISVSSSTKNLYQCSRFMLLKNDIPVGIFQEPDTQIDIHDTTPVNLYIDLQNYQYTLNLLKLQPEEIVKYTVIIWIEGWDKDCTDDKKEGAINYRMDFSIINIYDDKTKSKN